MAMPQSRTKDRMVVLSKLKFNGLSFCGPADRRKISATQRGRDGLRQPSQDQDENAPDKSTGIECPPRSLLRN